MGGFSGRFLYFIKGANLNSSFGPSMNEESGEKKSSAFKFCDSSRKTRGNNRYPTVFLDFGGVFRVSEGTFSRGIRMIVQDPSYQVFQNTRPLSFSRKWPKI